MFLDTMEPRAENKHSCSEKTVLKYELIYVEKLPTMSKKLHQKFVKFRPQGGKFFITQFAT